MASTMTCPSCRAALQVGNVAAGQQVKCPRCQAMVTMPAEGLVEVAIMEDLPASASPSPVGITREQPATATGPTRACPECGKPISVNARKCRYCKAWLSDQNDDDEVYRGQYAPCPNCRATGATRIVFTFWDSFYGPALFNHVRCPDCGYAYNGKTGRSNLIPAILFVTVPALGILIILGLLVYFIFFWR